MSVRDELNEVQDKLSQLDNNNRGDLAEISRLTTLRNELLAQQVLEERVIAQEEKVSTIKLPYDFDELYGDSTANKSITEVVKLFQRELNSEHNDEMKKVIDTHREEMRSAVDRELQLKRQNEELQQVTEQYNQEILRLTRELQQSNLERDDAFAKRDASAADKELIELLLKEKQEHIDKLRDEMAIGASRAINVVTVSPSDRLAALVQESKNAKVKSALDIALENTTPFRGKVNAVAELHTPEVGNFQPINQTSDTGFQLVTGPAAELPADDQVTPSEEDVHSGCAVDQGCTTENGQTLAEAFKRIEALEAKLGA